MILSLSLRIPSNQIWKSPKLWKEKPLAPERLLWTAVIKTVRKRLPKADRVQTNVDQSLHNQDRQNESHLSWETRDAALMRKKKKEKKHQPVDNHFRKAAFPISILVCLVLFPRSVRIIITAEYLTLFYYKKTWKANAFVVMLWWSRCKEMCKERKGFCSSLWLVYHIAIKRIFFIKYLANKTMRSKINHLIRGLNESIAFSFFTMGYKAVRRFMRWGQILKLLYRRLRLKRLSREAWHIMWIKDEL